MSDRPPLPTQAEIRAAFAPGQAELLISALAALQTPPADRPEGHRTRSERLLLTIEEAAAASSLSPSYFYKNGATLPFMVRLPGGGVRVNARRLAKWVEDRTRDGLT